MSLVKDKISDPYFISLLPSDFHPALKSVAEEMARAERHVQSIEEIVSKHYNVEKENAVARAGRRILSGGKAVPAKHLRSSSAADYHIRATSRMHGHHGLGNIFHHQQGYHGARAAREEGGMSRRLTDHNVCADLDTEDRKVEQCVRLADCARNYNLYDLFVFYFGDDIDFDTGTVDDKEKIKAEDEALLSGKVRVAEHAQLSSWPMPFSEVSCLLSPLIIRAS